MQGSQKAFSLIELLVVITIIGIITAVAVPAYNAYLCRSRAVDLMNALGSGQAEVEEYINSVNTSDCSGLGSSPYYLTNSSPNIQSVWIDTTGITYPACSIVAEGKASAFATSSTPTLVALANVGGNGISWTLLNPNKNPCFSSDIETSQSGEGGSSGGPCTLNSQCPASATCVGGTCVSSGSGGSGGDGGNSCVASSECPAGTICVGGVCSSGGSGGDGGNSCVTSSECPAGTICVGGVCSSGGSGGSGGGAGSPCTQDSQCSSGYSCVGGACSSGGSGGSSGGAGSPCTQDSQCSSGYSCVGGACASGGSSGGTGGSCFSDSDCPVGQTCNVATQTCN